MFYVHLRTGSACIAFYFIVFVTVILHCFNLFIDNFTEFVVLNIICNFGRLGLASPSVGCKRLVQTHTDVPVTQNLMQQIL